MLEPLYKQLVEAVKSGAVEIMVDLLKANNDLVNYKDEYGVTALHEAALSGQINSTNLLIRKGADINEKNNAGNTVLMFAAKGGSKEVAEF